MKTKQTPAAENEKLALQPDGSYIPTEDILQPLADGRLIIMAHAGIRISRTDALRAGLVSLKPGETFPEIFPRAHNPFFE